MQQAFADTTYVVIVPLAKPYRLTQEANP
jgi:hypothetical protein